MKRKIGIMGAMPEEIDGIAALLENKTEKTTGMRTYYTGEINGTAAVVVFSRWGKVAASATVSALIYDHGVTEIIFIGVAGAMGASINIGDIVIAKRLFQHDMDGRPLMKQYEIPLLGKTFVETDPALTAKAEKAVNKLISERELNLLFPDGLLKEFHITAPRLHTGDIASGDQFFRSKEQKDAVLSNLPGILCVEMEGAAVAQVCFEYGAPFTVIRTMSDSADKHADVDFAAFIKSISSVYSAQIIKNIFELY